MIEKADQSLHLCYSVHKNWNHLSKICTPGTLKFMTSVAQKKTNIILFQSAEIFSSLNSSLIWGV